MNKVHIGLKNDCSNTNRRDFFVYTKTINKSVLDYVNSEGSWAKSPARKEKRNVWGGDSCQRKI